MNNHKFDVYADFRLFISTFIQIRVDKHHSGLVFFLPSPFLFALALLVGFYFSPPKPITAMHMSPIRTRILMIWLLFFIIT